MRVRYEVESNSDHTDSADHADNAADADDADGDYVPGGISVAAKLFVQKPEREEG